MRNEKADVLIVGSGPAGATAGRYLAKNGFKTVILEAQNLDRDKPCAGGTTNRVYSEFEISEKHVIERPIKEVFLVAPDNETVYTKVSLPGALVLRPKFDKHLSELAMDEGAKIFEKTRAIAPILENNKVVGVKAKTSDGVKEFYSDLVIAADGTPSLFAKHFNLYRNDPEQLAITFQYQMAMNTKDIDEEIGDRIEIYFGSEWCPGGYTWIFPKKDVVAVGNGTWMNFIRKHKVVLKRRLNSFIETHPIAKEKLRKAKVLYAHGAPIGFPKILKQHYGNGFLIIGDAGGFVSYATAEGIYYSMKSGKLAAEFVTEVSENGSFLLNELKSFEKFIHDKLMQELYASIKIRQSLLSTDKKLKKIVYAAKNDKWFNKLVGDLIMGNIEYRRFLKTLYTHPHKLLKALLLY